MEAPRMIKQEQEEIPTEIQDKLKQFEDMTLETLKGPARLEDELYEDYVLRRTIEQKFLKYYFLGNPITAPNGKPNRKTRRDGYRTYSLRIGKKSLADQKKARTPKMCNICWRKFPACELEEHKMIHNYEVVEV